LGDHPSPVARDGGTKSATGPAGQSAPSAGQSALSLDEIQRVWPEVLQELAESEPALVATFESARPVAMEDAGLQIGFPADQRFNKKKAESPERREAVAAAFEAVVGQALKPSYVVLEDEAAPPDTPAPSSDEIDEEELLERLKSEFNAEEVS
jgi:hypothetical protein